jgi:hypothetical protein
VGKDFFHSADGDNIFLWNFFGQWHDTIKKKKTHNTKFLSSPCQKVQNLIDLLIVTFCSRPKSFRRKTEHALLF